jgi:cysteine desulfurase
MKKSDTIYFDNNATTLICAPAKKTYIEWLSCYNASSNSRLAKPIKTVISKATDILLDHCNISTATHTAIFTSGATESNCFIIRACVKAYKKKLIEKNSTMKPHIICSALEHHSSIECLKDLEETGDVDVSYIIPTIYGNVLPEDVEKAIKPNTCLITIMFANNEIPVINDIKSIGKIAHKNNIPMHSDCVQVFGKYKINVPENNIDALSLSAHKFYGPKGIGALIINNNLIEGYGLTAEINGSQQNGLRGGTENVAGIASLITALKQSFINRAPKNKKLYNLRNYLLSRLKENYKFGDFLSYVNNTDVESREILEIVSLGPPDEEKDFILINTVLISIIKNKGRPFCNVLLKNFLDDKNCVVSIGSACLTNNESSSHVLSSIGAPSIIKRGVIRISFGDNNTISEIDKFIKLFKLGIEKQFVDVKKEMLEKPKNEKVHEKTDEKEIIIEK